MRVVINYTGKKIKLDARKTGAFSKGLGLMFKSRETENLLFDFGRNVKYLFHSFFVFFPFLIIFLDENNKVIECRIAKPFQLCIKPKEKYRKVVELPFNSKNEKIIQLFMAKSPVKKPFV